MARSWFPLLAGGSLLLGLAAAGSDAVSAARAEAPLRLWPFGLMEGVRRAEGSVPMGVELCNAGEETLALLALEARDGAGRVVARLDLREERIAGDGGFVEDLLLKLEAISPDLSHRHHDRIFIPLETRQELGPDAEAALYRSIVADVRRLQADGAPQLRKLRFEVPLEDLFGPGARPGDLAPLTVSVLARDPRGAAVTATWEHAVELLPPFLGPPAERVAALGPGGWRVGDLHVHNCRDEAVGGCDSCPAETVNVFGGFTNAQLKNQFQALGFDYFSTTTHSYCINSDAEFQAVRSESQNLTDPSFVVICGTEISGREAGPQQGSDGADVFCALGFGQPVHHMGAHGTTTRKPGGDDGVLDFCDAPIAPQDANTAEVNAEGGFAIANHPAASLWAYNSVADLRGQEAGGLWGAEVWNGSEGVARFSGAHMAWWTARLREGRVLFPYSGSDTHDAAHDFGATHVFVPGAFTGPGLIAALKAGRNYLSNGPYLELELRGGGRTLPMGTVLRVPANRIPPGFRADVEVFYNLPTTTASTLTIYRGQAAGETVIARQTGLSGGGSVLVSDPVPSERCYWRAESVSDDATSSALTTPVFLRVF